MDDGFLPFILSEQCSNMKILVLMGLALSWGCMLILAITWFIAFLNGGYCLIEINRYGEMYLELILIPILLIWGGWALVRVVFSRV